MQPVRPPYAIIIAPSALAQIEEALTWWARNRTDGFALLARELDDAPRLLEHAPKAGRRIASRTLRGVRRVQLHRTQYILDYQISEKHAEVRVAHFRHGRRRSHA